MSTYPKRCQSYSTNKPPSKAIPLSPSSFLRSGSKFIGSQSSETQTYDVQVEIKHVDMRESFICGYLRIQGSQKSLQNSECRLPY